MFLDCPGYVYARETFQNLYQSHTITVSQFLNRPQCNNDRLASSSHGSGHAAWTKTTLMDLCQALKRHQINQWKQLRKGRSLGLDQTEAGHLAHRVPVEKELHLVSISKGQFQVRQRSQVSALVSDGLGRAMKGLLQTWVSITIYRIIIFVLQMPFFAGFLDVRNGFHGTQGQFNLGHVQQALWISDSVKRTLQSEGSFIDSAWELFAILNIIPLSRKSPLEGHSLWDLAFITPG